MFPLFKNHKKTQWLCMVEGATVPKVRHDTYKSAKDEAIRLAKVTGKPTYLLQILKKYDSEVTEVTYKNVL